MDDLATLTVGASLLCGALGVAGMHVYATGRARHQSLVQRLADAEGQPLPGPGRRFTGVDRRLRGTRLGRAIELRLTATGLDLTPGEFFVYTAGTAIGLWLIAQATLATFFGPIAAVVTV